MKLIRKKIGDLITPVNEKNTLGENLEIFGINRDKEFMPTVASVSNVDKKKYKLLKKGYFVFSGMQTGRDKCIRLGLYDNDDIVLISSAYTTFKVTSDLILPEYFFMIFKSDEKDRYGAFLSDGSIRSNLDWDVFCNIELSLPDIRIQRKYVNIYNSLIKNKNVYNKNIEDLKKALVGTLEKLKNTTKKEKIGKYIAQKNNRNTDNYDFEICGVKKDRTFIPTIANVNTDNISSYKIVLPEEFAYSNRINIGSIAMRYNTPCLVSTSYTVFELTNKDILLPEYLSLWFLRDEFCHYAFFYSYGSVKDELSFEELSEMEIPIPEIDVQKSIINLFKVYKSRINYYNRLKNRMNSICPILIKGSMMEAVNE